jgi:hypothetical protein
MKKVSTALVLALIASCGGGEPRPADGGSVPTGADVPLPAIDMYLVIADSIGVEMGDSNYVFGMPMLAAHAPDGEIAVFDAQKMSLLFYSPDGEFLRQVGREGSGPGEFLMPSSFAFVPGGGLVVADAMSGKLTFFDSTYTYVREVSGFFPQPPAQIRCTADGAVVGLQSVFEQDEEGMRLGFKLARWEGEDFEETVVYHETLNPFDPTDIASAIQENMFFFTTTDEGMVFRSPFSSSNFLIEGYQPDGTSCLMIEDDDYRRVPKSEEEIQTEIDLVNERLSIAGVPPGTIEWEPDPYRPAVFGLFMDAGEHLWARLGYYREVVFEVFDTDGNHVAYAMLDYPGDVDDLVTWQVIVDEQGILAFDTSPEDYPRIYMLEESERPQD